MKCFVATALLAFSALGASSLQDLPTPPAATPEHKWLLQLVGEWKMNAECWMGPEAPPMKMESEEKVRAVGDLWIVGEGSAKHGEHAFTSLLTLGYDPAKKHFVGTWVDTMQTHLWVYRGTLDEAKKVLTLEAEGPAFDDPTKTALYKDAIELVSPDHKILRSSMKQPDGTWQNFLTADYRRQR